MIAKHKLVTNLRKLQAALCSYLPSGAHCDCKFGQKDDKPSLGRSECFPGCPELKQALIVINAMTPTEWERVIARAGSTKKRPRRAK